MQVGMVMHTYNPAHRRLRQDDGKFKASLSHTTVPCPERGEGEVGKWGGEGRKGKEKGKKEKIERVCLRQSFK